MNLNVNFNYASGQQNWNDMQHGNRSAAASAGGAAPTGKADIAGSIATSIADGMATGIADDIAGDGSAASDEKKAGRRSSPAECETCKSRKYQDGSDEMVSFKSASHINPNAAASVVRGHEQEHVNNAFSKAAQENGRVISASVSIHTAVCPECGRTYVSGGTTNTQIKYYNEENPYQQDLKIADAAKYAGMNVNAGV